MKVEVDKQVNDELEAIKTEMDYSGEVGTRVKMQVQLEIVCKHILGESIVGNSNGERGNQNAETQPKSSATGGKKDKVPKTKCETSAEIELPWISDLEPASSKVCISRKPNYVLITDHIRSTREYCYLIALGSGKALRSMRKLLGDGAISEQRVFSGSLRYGTPNT